MNASPSQLVFIAQIVGLLALLYWFLIRPNAQAQKKADAMRSALRKGDDITTAGGIVGKVRDIKDQLVTIESGTSTLVVDRSRIVRVGNNAPGSTT